MTDLSNPVVEVEEDVYHYEPPDNGAGPMWCHGNTCIVRVGDDVVASGLETLPGAKPLNNCVPMLFKRSDIGWEQVYKATDRTREPSPLTCLDGRILLSVNPTLTPPETRSGPAQPQVLEFSAAHPRRGYRTIVPGWQGQPAFTEHSYRSFVADGSNGEMILFQNIGYTHAEWAFCDGKGAWSAQGQLVWLFYHRIVSTNHKILLSQTALCWTRSRIIYPHPHRGKFSGTTKRQHRSLLRQLHRWLLRPNLIFNHNSVGGGILRGMRRF